MEVEPPSQTMHDGCVGKTPFYRYGELPELCLRDTGKVDHVSLDTLSRH